MKRIFFTTVLILMVSLLVAGPVSAQKGKVNINGEVTEKSVTTLTILSNKGETIVVTVPDGFDTSSIEVGASVLVKAVPKDGGGWQAQSIKQVGSANGNENGNEATPDENEVETENNDDQAEGSKDNSAYCADSKQDKPHPLAAKMAERYGVTQDFVMGYFCDGYGMGAIMLALKTNQLNGTSPDALLAERANGVGWGNIWKNLKLIGNEKNGFSPPGLLKKKDK
jgi:hypothetical protein